MSDSHLEFECPHCEQAFAGSLDYLNTRFTCLKCGCGFLISRPSVPKVSASPSAPVHVWILIAMAVAGALVFPIAFTFDALGFAGIYILAFIAAGACAGIKNQSTATVGILLVLFTWVLISIWYFNRPAPVLESRSRTAESTQLQPKFVPSVDDENRLYGALAEARRKVGWASQISLMSSDMEVSERGGFSNSGRPRVNVSVKPLTAQAMEAFKSGALSRDVHPAIKLIYQEALMRKGFDRPEVYVSTVFK